MIMYFICSSELEIVVCEWLRKLEPSLYCVGIFKLNANVGITINVPWEYIFKVMIILCHKLPTFNLELNCRLTLMTCRRVVTEHFFCLFSLNISQLRTANEFIIAVPAVKDSIFPVKWVTITLDIQKWRNEGMCLVATLGVPPAKSVCCDDTMHLTLSRSIGYEVGRWDSTVRQVTDGTFWKYPQSFQ
jgi:hypothetical protein